MKKILLVLGALLTLTIASNANANYYYQQVNVSVQFQFVAYAPQPQMCIYKKLVPRWNYECGVQAAMVQGCMASHMGYMCGGASVAQTVCAYRLYWLPYQFVDYCGRY